jgi:hypothetical protein
VRQVTYQLSDQRQTIVSVNSPKVSTTKETVVELTRAVRILDAPSAVPSGVPSAIPGATNSQPSSAPAKVASPAVPNAPIRLAVLDGQTARLVGLTPLETPFEIVHPKATADLIWDPNSGDVIADGDVVARGITKSDLPSLVDRAAAVRHLKQLAARAPQVIRVLPNSQIHRRGSRVEVQISQIENRALFLFDIAGDGTVQMLYPLGSDANTLSSQQYNLPIQVREPFGADQIIAVTAPQRMVELEQAFARLNERRTSGQVMKLLSRYADNGLRVGSVSVFTAP